MTCVQPWICCGFAAIFPVQQKRIKNSKIPKISINAAKLSPQQRLGCAHGTLLDNSDPPTHEQAGNPDQKQLHFRRFTIAEQSV
jgi:hypothetical protein